VQCSSINGSPAEIAALVEMMAYQGREKEGHELVERFPEFLSAFVRDQQTDEAGLKAQDQAPGIGQCAGDLVHQDVSCDASPDAPKDRQD
jgi:hypothetical protein